MFTDTDKWGSYAFQLSAGVWVIACGDVINRCSNLNELHMSTGMHIKSLQSEQWQ